MGWGAVKCKGVVEALAQPSRGLGAMREQRSSE